MKKIILLLICSLTFSGLFAQNTVRGTVTGEGEALPGVNVLLKGTSKGVVTDIDGSYSIEVPGEDAVLQFSYIGFKPKEVTVGNRSQIDVTLETDLLSLQEVVVVGYGTTTKKEATGAVSAVNSEQIEKLNPQRVDQALQGQVAGVNINAASGSPGGAFNIRIRGITTNGNNNPLILVDGVRYDPAGLNALNPNDIESINVLKDATAGIYGVQSANGVIMITTKKGKLNTKPKLNFSGYYGVQETTNKLDLLNAREYAVLKNEAFAAGNQTQPFNNVALGEGTDWQNQVFQTAPIQNYNLTVTGGSDKTSYSFGGSYLDQEGIVGGPQASFRRLNARLNFVTELAPKVKLENVLLYTNEQRKTLPEFSIGSVLYNAVNAYPTEGVFQDDGSYSYLGLVNDVINPVTQMANTYNDNVTNKIVGKQEITYDINDDFTVTGRAGYNYAIYDGKFFSPLVYYGPGKAQNTALDANLTPIDVNIIEDIDIPRLSSVTETRQTFLDYNFEAFVNYQRVFNDAHNFKAILGTSLFGTSNSAVFGTAFDIPYNSWDFADISAADENNLLNNSSSWQNRTRLMSIFLRTEYSYQEKYLASFIIRRDGSSNFGPNNRIGYFPTLSAGWVISEEDFFNPGFMDFAKVRASFGVTGNDRIPLFAYRGLLEGEGVYVFNDQLSNGIAFSQLGNPDLKWETTSQANLGLNLSFLQGAINLDADYYIKTTRDLLFTPDVSGVLGAYGAGSAPPVINAGDVRNSGIDLSIAYNQQLSSDLNLNLTYNFTTINNEVLALPEGVDFIEGGPFGIGAVQATRMEVGFPIGYFFGFETEGVYQNQEQVAGRGVAQQHAEPGALIFRDADGDGTVEFGNNEDKVMIGSPIPDVTMGFNLGADYKGFDFSAFFYASIGNDILRNFERQLPYANWLDYRIARWIGEGSTNEHPRLTTGPNNNAQLSDYFIEDGSFLRLRNIQLGYSLPANVMQTVGLSNARIYIAANNLLTLTKYRGFDPDFSGVDPLASGIDYGFYPQAKSYMVGLNLNF